MALPARVHAPIQGGVLTIEDAEVSGDDVVDADPVDGVAAGRSQVMITVTHGQEGTTDVLVVDGPDGVAGHPVYDGELQVTSGTLWIGDVVGETGISVAVPTGPVRLTVVTRDPAPDPELGFADLVVMLRS